MRKILWQYRDCRRRNDFRKKKINKIKRKEWYLHNITSATKNNGLIYNNSKCNVKTNSVKFFSEVWCASRLKENRGHEGTEKPTQWNRITTHSGNINIHGPIDTKIVRTHCQLTSPYLFTWTKSQAFRTNKSLNIEEIILVYFSPTRPALK